MEEAPEDWGPDADVWDEDAWVADAEAGVVGVADTASGRGFTP